MSNDNPFAQFSPEDQQYIGDQLRRVQNHPALSAQDVKDVQQALTFLPMSKGQRNSEIQSLQTGGAGTWRPAPAKVIGPSFAESDKTALARQAYRNSPAYVPRPQDAPDELDGGVGNIGLKGMQTVSDAMSAKAGQMGGKLGAAISPNVPGMGDARPIGRAIGSFAGQMATDPTTYALGGLPESRVISAGFSAMGVHGAAEGAQQLHEVWGREDIPRERKLELGTNIAINALMAGVAGTHSIKGFLDTTQLPPVDKLEIQQKIEAGWTQQDGKLIRREGAGYSGPADIKDALGGIFKKPDTTVQPQTPGQRDALSSLTGRTGPRAVNPDVNARLHPEGTTLNPFVTREPEGRIPLSLGDANNARSAGFGSAVFTPQTRGIPAAGEPPIEPTKSTTPSPETMPRMPGESTDAWMNRVNSASFDNAWIQKHGTTPPEDIKNVAGELNELTKQKEAERDIDPKTGKPWDFGVQSHFDRLKEEAGEPSFKPGVSETVQRYRNLLADKAYGDKTRPGDPSAWGPGGEAYYHKLRSDGLDHMSAIEAIRQKADSITQSHYNEMLSQYVEPREAAAEAMRRMQNDPGWMQTGAKAAAPEVVSKPFEQHLNDYDKQFLNVLENGSAERGKEVTEPPVPKKGEPTDLRGLSDDARHDWKNKNASGVSISGATSMSDARERLAKLSDSGIVPSTNVTSKITSFIDKDGQTKYTVAFAPKEAGPTNIDLPKGDAPLDKNLSMDVLDTIQKGENKFNDLTKGAHKQVLQDLWAHVEKSSVEGTPKEAKMARYAEGLQKLVKALNGTADVPNMLKAFDAVTKKGEGGFAAPFGKRRLSDVESRNLAKLHADTVLGRWEALDDNALKGTKVAKKLSDPALKNSVYGANDPQLEARYANLLERADKARLSDPILSLGTTLSGHDLTAADVVKGQMRESRGGADRDFEQRKAALKGYRDSWKSRPIEDTIQFISSIEGGDINSIADPTDKAMAQRLRDLLDAGRGKIQELGKQNLRTRMNEYDSQILGAKSVDQAKMWEGERQYAENMLKSGHTSLLDKFYDTYFPHLWRYGIKDAISDVISRRRPLAPSSFLKQRTYQTFADGMANGMEPVTYNPVDMVLLKLHEMDRFATAHETFNQLRDMDLAHIYSAKDVPYGWEKVNDGMFNAGANAAWYMPADAAKPLNRYLSPGLRGNVLYDSIAHYNNLVNAANLGLSLFHGTATAVNAIASRFGLGAEKLTRFAEFPQNLKGLKDIAASPFEPVMAPIRGYKIAAEYMSPGTYSEYSATANGVETGGGRIRMPEEFRNQNIQAFRNSWKEVGDAWEKKNVGKVAAKSMLGVYRAMGAILEGTSIPLMEKYVPYTKLGVFHGMAEDITDRLPGSPNKTLVQKEFDYAWDRVDDRMGQVVYDNMFWNRMGKDMAHLLIRAVGWNFGDVRELGGAVWDLADKQNLKNAVTGKGITGKQGYVMGLLATTSVMGYLLNHAYGQKVDDPIDLLYPKNGKMNPDGSPQRIYVKTYVHDAYNFGRHPVQSGADKLAPVWHQIEEMYTNADYYGTQIHPVHATALDAAKDPDTYTDSAKYMMQNPEPFSYRNFQQRQQSGESTLSALGSTVGILPAPKWVGETPATSLASALYKTTYPASKDAIVQANMQRYHELASGYEAKRFTSADVTAAWKARQINAKQYDGILDEKDGQLSPLQRMVKPLYPHQFLRVWDKATMQEKDALSTQFFQKWDKIETTAYSSEQAAKYTAAYNTAWKQYRETKSKESKSN